MNGSQYVVWLVAFLILEPAGVLAHEDDEPGGAVRAVQSACDRAKAREYYDQLQTKRDAERPEIARAKQQ